MSSRTSGGVRARRRRTLEVARGLLVLALGLLSLTSCGGPDDVDLTGQWRLERLVSAHGQVRVGHPNATNPSLGVARGHAGVSDGCNWWGFATEIDGSSVRFTLDGRDRSYGPCSLFDPTHGSFPRLLARVRHAVRDGDTLLLTGPGVRLELSRPRADPHPIAPMELSISGGWRLVRGRFHGRAIPIVALHPVVLGMEYDADYGLLRSGCNGARVTLGAGWFRLGAASQQRCGPRLMHVERYVFHGMTEVNHFESTAHGMVLSGRHVALTFRSVPDPDLGPLIGRWRVIGTRTGGVTTPATHERRVRAANKQLLVREDLSFRLTTGCRRLDGTWGPLVDRTGTIPITRMSTVTSCSRLGDRERRSEAALSSVTWVRLRGGRLALQDDTGPGLLLRRMS